MTCAARSCTTCATCAARPPRSRRSARASRPAEARRAVHPGGPSGVPYARPRVCAERPRRDGECRERRRPDGGRPGVRHPGRQWRRPGEPVARPWRRRPAGLVVPPARADPGRRGLVSGWSGASWCSPSSSRRARWSPPGGRRPGPRREARYRFGDVQRGDVVVFDGDGLFADRRARRQRCSSAPARRSRRALWAVPVGETDSSSGSIGVGGDHVVCCDAEGRHHRQRQPVTRALPVPRRRAQRRRRSTSGPGRARSG